ncbi:MAG: acyl-ACP desaturase [Flavobacteriaceae bacterium]|nr:acyl-ACP desaturase [Flavobacteriaceae bacterium]MDZ4147279.1 acyl-ACP desaturase [Flavobacteriaceae bacterium]
MLLHPHRKEVMKALEPEVEAWMQEYLIPAEKIWQPTDLLPDSSNENFYESVRQIREEARELPYDFWVVLVADAITEEALPTYESWIMDIEGVNQHERNGWSRWTRHWTAEENRHGDALNKYLYLSGMVNMKEIEITTQHIISDGFAIGTGRDPYKNFVYTSFQELATHISHKRVGQLAQKKQNKLLGNMCKLIAGDEMRHYMAYRSFIQRIFSVDPSEMMIAFSEMMKTKIVMPAHFIRESGGVIGDAFENFSNAAQRLGVYTTEDYIDILKKLTDFWDIANIRELNDRSERARDYVMNLPDRLAKISERIKIPQDPYAFKWVTV